MAIVSCKSCGHEVVIETVKCPQCGQRLRKQQYDIVSFGTWAGPLGFICILCFVVWLSSTNQATNHETKNKTDKSRQSAPKTSLEKLKALVQDELRARELDTGISSDRSPNVVHDAFVWRMTHTERKEFLSNAVTQSGESCGNPKRIFFQGFDEAYTAHWNVECATGKSFSIQIKNDKDGTVMLLDCKMLKSMGVNCFEKF